MPYGVEPPEPGTVQRAAAGGAGWRAPPDVPLLAAAFGPIELEYASLRKDCVIIDRPDRVVIEVSGADARDFLGRMLTNDVVSLEPGQSCGSFWLNRKGRIDADLRVLRLREPEKAGPTRFHLDVERGSLDLALRTLGAYVITEDVALVPRHDLHRLSLHGPRAADLLLATSGSNTIAFDLAPNANVEVETGDGLGCRIDRHDTAGCRGTDLRHARGGRGPVQTLLRAGRGLHAHEPNAPDPPRGRRWPRRDRTPDRTADRARSDRVRSRSACAPAGGSRTTSRGSGGHAAVQIDFGPENLPAETGVLEDRVNFKKGCYLGQEVVARMREGIKQRLVALRFDDDLPPGSDGLPPLPVQGTVCSPCPPGPRMPSHARPTQRARRTIRPPPRAARRRTCPRRRCPCHRGPGPAHPPTPGPSAPSPPPPSVRCSGGCPSPSPCSRGRVLRPGLGCWSRPRPARSVRRCSRAPVHPVAPQVGSGRTDRATVNQTRHRALEPASESTVGVDGLPGPRIGESRPDRGERTSGVSRVGAGLRSAAQLPLPGHRARVTARIRGKPDRSPAGSPDSLYPHPSTIRASMPDPTRVIIVGGGLAGLAAAVGARPRPVGDAD